MSMANSRQVASTSSNAIFALIRDDLRIVEEHLQTQLQNDAPMVDELLRYAGSMGGKRLRPALLILSARATGDLSAEHHVLAAVIEMIHLATLIHDDVLDDADVRRHVATVNARWDNQASVLLGDYLFTHAFYLASTTGSATACRIIGQATNAVCDGELRQVGNRSNFALSEDEYFHIIQSKTAALCACAGELGAHFAGANAFFANRMADYGRFLGTSFQIADDLLDLVGDQTKTGKSMGTDLEKHKPTLPLIHLLSQVSDEKAEVVRTLLADEDRAGDRCELLHAWFQEYGCLQYARDKAVEFADLAARQLDGLRD